MKCAETVAEVGWSVMDMRKIMAHFEYHLALYGNWAAAHILNFSQPKVILVVGKVRDWRALAIPVF